MHRRALIFNRVVENLSAIPEFSGAGKVKRGRSAAIPQELLPALTPTWAEGNETATLRPCSGPAGEDGYDRMLPLSVIIHLRDVDADEEFDRISVLVEKAMGSDILLSGLAVEVLQTSSRLYIDPRTGLPLGAGSVNYQVFYKTVANNPETAAL
ncbi:hypothetical protein [Agrobacterium tumefaciens]|uniref:hypothetical protein n=1 Tax=Agrobacterium tumefaciens TaxID=358 RepID=UPI0021CF69AD|nr:hypothetical protein [Agrobacterium tumefaciens]